MINTDKYEGHTPGPWTIDVHKVGEDTSAIVIESNMTTHSNCALAEVEVENKYAEADARLMADAPLLLEEVKRLRGLLMKGSEDYTTSYMDLRRIIEDVHWELTGDEHESNEARIKYALIALSEVIG